LGGCKGVRKTLYQYFVAGHLRSDDWIWNGNGKEIQRLFCKSRLGFVFKSILSLALFL